MTFGTTSYLEQIEKAPASERFKLIRNWMDSSPLPFFEELRKTRPILETDLGTLFARFDDVVEVLSHPDVFTVQFYQSKLGSDFMLSQDDTPLHTREKGIMQAMLNRDDLPRVREIIKKRANEFLDAGNGKIELVNDFGRSIPVALVQDYFGFEGIEPKQLKEWSFWIQYDSFHNHPFSLPTDPEAITQKANESRKALGEYLKGLVPQIIGRIKSGNTPDTVVARILSTQFPESVGFPIQNAVRNMSGLLIGAVETTSQAGVQIVQELLRRPDELAAAIDLARDDAPEFDGYVWEALRFNPIGPYLFRKSSADYTVANGTDRAAKIPAGITVLPLIMSAMFDATRFPDPHTFNAQRPWYDTFHMGFGIHECLGKYLGMVMIPEMVKQVILRPGIKADGAIDFRGTPFPDFYPVSWDNH
jgi:cytochrome P450